MFLNSFNHFRAIAIIFIVFGHTYSFGGLVPNSLIEKTIMNLITGGSAFFVFISGFLFHHIFYKRYTFSSFMKGKIKNVLIPYLILSFLPMMYFVITVSSHYDGYYLPQSSGFIGQYIIPTLNYLWTGRALPPYWYIPFIMVTFVMSPLHFKFIRLPLKAQLYLVFFFLIVSMLVHLPTNRIGVFQMVLYYFPIYLIGIMASIERNVIYKKLEKSYVYLLIIAIVLTMVLSINTIFAFKIMDFMLLQKILLSFFFMVWLNRFEHYQNKWIHRLASTSFAVFFIHPYFIYFFRLFFNAGNYGSTESWIRWFLISFVILMGSMIAAILLRRLLPKYSRFITGY